MPDLAPDGADEFTYTYKPAVLGGGWLFRLTGEGVAWDNGRGSGIAAYRDINRVRMTYRPSTVQPNRFVTQIWAHNAPRLTIGSTSWHGMLEQQSQNDPYIRFIAELHRRIAATGGWARFEAGVHPFVYWFGFVFIAAVTIAITGLVLRAATSGFWSAASVLAAFLAFFVWSGFAYFRRNRPGTYRPDTLPPQLLPGG